MSILCLIMHVLCEYALKLVFGFFCLSLGQGLAFLV